MFLSQRLCCTGAIGVVTYCPCLTGATGNSSHGIEDIKRCCWAGATDDFPRGAVPMLDQRHKRTATTIATLAGSARGLVPDGPDVLRGEGSHAKEAVVGATGIGAGDNTPFAAIPPLNERIILTTILIKSRSHSPEIVSRNDGHAGELIVCQWNVGAIDDAPGFPIPMLDQRH